MKTIELTLRDNAFRIVYYYICDNANPSDSFSDMYNFAKSKNINLITNGDSVIRKMILSPETLTFILLSHV